MDILKKLNPLSPYKCPWDNTEAIKMCKDGQLVAMKLKSIRPSESLPVSIIQKSKYNRKFSQQLIQKWKLKCKEG